MRIGECENRPKPPLHYLLDFFLQPWVWRERRAHLLARNWREELFVVGLGTFNPKINVFALVCIAVISCDRINHDGSVDWINVLLHWVLWIENAKVDLALQFLSRALQLFELNPKLLVGG